MPLDGTNYKVKVEPLQTGLAGLKQIGNALRWQIPDTHQWDFKIVGLPRDCSTYGCAIGVVNVLWKLDWHEVSDVASHLKISQDGLRAIFGFSGVYEFHSTIYGDIRYEAITPHDVADAIDRYIAGKGGV